MGKDLISWNFERTTNLELILSMRVHYFPINFYGFLLRGSKICFRVVNRKAVKFQFRRSNVFIIFIDVQGTKKNSWNFFNKK